jgi:quinol monooxygenase YgiN
MVHVLVTITAKPGMRDALLELFAANVPAVRAERGCLEYGAAFDADGFDGVQSPLGPDTFVVIEKWEDGDALKAHAAAPHMKAYGAASKELIAQRVLHVLAPA